VGKLLERHREVVALASRLDHRRRVLAEAALSQVVEVAVDLPRPLRRDDDRGVVGVSMLQQLVYAWLDHSGRESRGMPSSARTIPSSSSAARPRSSLTTWWANSSRAAISWAATSSRASIAWAGSVPRALRRSRRTVGSGGAMKTWTDSRIAARTW